MAYCRKCGSPLNEGAKFCPKCGNEVFSAQKLLERHQREEEWLEYLNGGTEVASDKDITIGIKVMFFLLPVIGIFCGVVFHLAGDSKAGNSSFIYSILSIVISIAIMLIMGVKIF